MKKNFQEKYSHHCIGLDESGVGDYFGPLVTTASYIADPQLCKVIKIKDCKQFSDEELLATTNDLLTNHQDKFFSKTYVLKMEYYNTLLLNQKTHRVKINSHHLKTMCHIFALDQLCQKLTKNNILVPTIILDAFCSEKNWIKYQTDLLKNHLINPNMLNNNVNHFIEKADLKYYSVALSSMLARTKYLQIIQKLSQKYQIHILKGANLKVQSLVKKVKQKQPQNAMHLIKLNFKI